MCVFPGRPNRARDESDIRSGRTGAALSSRFAAERHYDTGYAVSHFAAREWDDLGIVLATPILAHLIPGGVAWLVVDPVLSSKRHKTFRFGRILSIGKTAGGDEGPLGPAGQPGAFYAELHFAIFPTPPLTSRTQKLPFSFTF